MAVAERSAAGTIHERWNQLYTDHYRLAFRVAREHVRNEADAEDAVQKTFIGVYELLDRGTNVDNWEAMITTIAKRAATKERSRSERTDTLEPHLTVDQV